MVLDKSDCSLVQVIHTSAEEHGSLSLIQRQFGSNRKAGHCDYWINCGFGQDHCATADAGQQSALDSLMFCSHQRAHEVYTDQLNGVCSFSVQQCSDCGQTRQCSKNGTLTGFSLTPDDECTRQMDHSFFVDTNIGPITEGLC